MTTTHTTHTTATAGTLVWVATYASLDGAGDVPVGVFATRAAAVASVANDIDAWEVEGGIDEHHVQPEGQQPLWYSAWEGDAGCLIWTVRATVLG